MNSKPVVTAVLTTFVAIASLACAQDFQDEQFTDLRLSLPSGEETDDAIKSIKASFSADFARAEKSDSSKSYLSRKLLESAIETSDDPVSRYAGAIEAKRLAIESADVKTLAKCIEFIISHYRVIPSQLNAESFEKVNVAAAPFPVVTEFGGVLLIAVEDAAKSDDLDATRRLLVVADRVARRVSDKALKGKFERADEVVKNLLQQRVDYESAVGRIENDSNDLVSQEVVGIYLGLRLNDWEEGEKHIAISGNERLLALFQRECSQTSGIAEGLSLADDWWDWAATQKEPVKSQGKVIAADRYQSLLPQTSGLAKKRAEERLKSVGTPFPVRRGATLSVSTEVELALPDEVLFYRSFDDGSAEGKVGRAIEFNPSEHVDIETNDLPSGNDARSVLFWLRTDQTDRDAVAFRYGELQPLDAVYLCLLDTSRGVPGRQGSIQKGQAVVGSVGGAGEFGAGPILTDGEWHHYALTHDGITTSIFIDGKRVGQARRTFRTSPTTLIRLGRYDDGPTMRGAMDDFVILDRVARTNEIQKIMSDGVMKTMGKSSK